MHTFLKHHKLYHKPNIGITDYIILLCPELPYYYLYKAVEYQTYRDNFMNEGKIQAICLKKLQSGQ